MPETTPLACARRFFLTAGLELEGRLIIAAVSGGPDSVCLLHVLHALSGEFGFQLHVAHLNHQLRGVEADEDARWVAKLAGRMNLPFTVEARDVAGYRNAQRLSLEEAAREIRYRFLADVAAETGASYIATGHTAADRAETVLMNLVRGSGTRGLRGLLPIYRRKTNDGDITVIRPLLEVAREATESYCREHGLETRLDATNLTEVPFRNKIRRRLLPLLREYNPRIMESLLRTACLAADDIDFIDTEVARLLPSVLQVEQGAVSLDKASLLALHPALRRYILREALRMLRGDLQDVEAGHIEDMMAALEKPAGRVIGLPDNLCFCVEYNRFVLAEDTAALCPLPPLAGEHVLEVPGTLELPGWSVTAQIVPLVEPESLDADDDGYSARLDADIAGEPLMIRGRLPGDRFIPLGMTSEKKLNRFMMDERIPRSWRARVPLVLAWDHIAWVAGWRIDDGFKVTADTRRVLSLSFKQR